MTRRTSGTYGMELSLLHQMLLPMFLNKVVCQAWNILPMGGTTMSFQLCTGRYVTCDLALHIFLSSCRLLL